MTHVECAKMMRRIDNEVHGRYNAIGEDSFFIYVNAEVFLWEQWQFFAAARFEFHLAVVSLGELDKILNIPTSFHP